MWMSAASGRLAVHFLHAATLMEATRAPAKPDIRALLAQTALVSKHALATSLRQ